MKAARILNALLAIYCVGYLAFRKARSEVWQKDGRAYVIFPERGGLALSYLWGPLSYLDAKITGTRTRIGPHQE